MKKIAILLALLALCLCIVPCCAEENDDSIVMDGEAFLTTSAPVPPVDPDAPEDSGEDLDIGEATTIPGSAADVPTDKDSLVTPIAPSAPEYAGDTTTTGAVIGGADGPTAILVAESDSDIEFHPENFMSSLSYMGTGMIGIFIVIGLIVLATVLLNKVFSDKTKKD